MRDGDGVTGLMLFFDADERRRERTIRRVLRTLSMQRVAMVLPGDVLVIEYAVMERKEGITEALQTCHLRGWAEIVHSGIRKGELGPGGQLPPGWSGRGSVYRLTDTGWAQLRRTHEWLIATFLVSLVGTIAAVIGLVYLTK